MPRLLDPDSNFDAVLESDKERTPTPTFTFKALSKKRFVHIVDAYESLEDIDGDVDKVNAIFDFVREGLIGWRNMGGKEFDPAALDDLLTIGEGVELLEYMLAGQQLAGDEAKN